MSYNFLHKLIKIFKSTKDFEFKNINEIISTGIILGCHAGYIYGTSEIKNIQILNKYSFVRNGYTEFMIIDQNGKHYNMINSFWYWKWNSIEDWNKLNYLENRTVRIYGYRIPIFGIFPNIVSIDCLSEKTIYIEAIKFGP